jgi:hypothetical protein
VLIDLVVNVRDAIPKGGRITIATSTAQLDDNAFTASYVPWMPSAGVLHGHDQIRRRLDRRGRGGRRACAQSLRPCHR